MNLDGTGGQYNPYAAPVYDAAPIPVGYDGSLILAERGTRLGAFLLDRLLLMACLIPPAVVGVFLLGQESSQHRQPDEPDAVILILVAGMFAAMTLPLLVYQWYLISKTGQTLGEKWLGIKIVKLDGSPVDFMTGVVKRNWLVMVLSMFVGCIRLVDILVIFGDERRCLHDHIAETKVVLAR